MGQEQFDKARKAQQDAAALAAGAFDQAVRGPVEKAVVDQLKSTPIPEGHMLVIAVHPTVKPGTDGKTQVKVVAGSFSADAKAGVITDAVVATDLGPQVQTQWANCGLLALSAAGNLSLTGIRVHAHPEMAGTKGAKQGTGSALVKLAIK